MLAVASGLALSPVAPAHADSGATAAPAPGGAAVAARAERVRVRRAPHRVLAGRPVRLSGVITSRRRGRPVVLQLRTPRGWRTVDRARTRRRGAWVTSWRADVLGRHALRARPGGRRSARLGAPGRPRVVRVFRRSLVSWFGPGFYGRRTACGHTLGPATLGVAHKWLACGSRVTFAHAGRTVTVPVIDRGPYVGAREWDLTAATRQRLRAPSTGMVWSSR
jgi:hypothetical protein